MADDGSDAQLRGRDLVGLGGLLAGAVILCTAIGLLIDSATDSSPTFALLGVGLGIVVGALGFWLRVRSALRG
jgi:hypothetical protein